MKIYYKSPEIDTDLYIEVGEPGDKPFTLIYGPNGIGKTSFANSIKEKNKNIADEYEIKVFTRNYIHKNVYVNTSNGANTETMHNQYWGDIFLGFNINDKINELNKVFELLRKIEINFNNIDFEHLFKILDSLYSIEQLKGIFNATFTNEIMNSNTYQNFFQVKETSFDFLSLSEYERVDISIKNENAIEVESIRQEIDKILNKSELEIANSIILLYNSVFEKMTFLNEKINLYNLSLLNLLNLENAIEQITEILGNQFEYTENVKKWILDGADIHKNIKMDKCIFCGNSNIILLEKHKIVLSDEIMKLKKEIIQLKKSIDEILKTEIKIKKDIIKNIDIFHNIFKDENDFLKYFENFKITDNNIKIALLIVPHKIELIEINNINYGLLKTFLINENSNYIIEVKKIYFKDKLKLRANILNEEIDNIINTNINEIAKIINGNELFLGIDEKIEIGVIKAPGQTNDKKRQLVFKRNNNNLIKSISDGQRFKFALMLFIEEISKEIHQNNEKKYLLVFDDPIDSSDMFTYFSFKSLLIKKLAKESLKDKIKIIVLTHNIDYSSIQFNTNQKQLKKMEFIRMYKNKSNNINYKELFTNDKVMFLQLHKKLIDSIKKNNTKIEFNNSYLLIYLTLSRKFINQFLEEIYVSQSMENLDVDELTINKLIEKINENIENEQVKIFIRELKTIIVLLNNNWFAKKNLQNEEIYNVIKNIIKINEVYFISPNENEKYILNLKNVVIKNSPINIEDLNKIENFENWNDQKYLLASKIFAKKSQSQSSELQFIKSFLRHPNSNFYKPFIAIDEEILLKITSE